MRKQLEKNCFSCAHCVEGQYNMPACEITNRFIEGKPILCKGYKRYKPVKKAEAKVLPCIFCGKLPTVLPVSFDVADYNCVRHKFCSEIGNHEYLAGGCSVEEWNKLMGGTDEQADMQRV